MKKIGHRARIEVKVAYPMHITVRLRAGMPNLRSKPAFQVFRHAIEGAKARGLRVLHFAVLGNHFHILAEATDNTQLARAMRSLNIRIAIGINRLLMREKGTVLNDRYNLQRLTTPTQVRNALIYIFSNAAKHFKRTQVFDLFSSVVVFEKIGALARTRRDLDWRCPPLNDKQRQLLQRLLSPPVSWLARTGWQRSATGRIGR